MIPGAAKTDGTRLPDSQCGQKGGLATASAIAAMSGKTVCCKFCYFKLLTLLKYLFNFSQKFTIPGPIRFRYIRSRSCYGRNYQWSWIQTTIFSNHLLKT